MVSLSMEQEPMLPTVASEKKAPINVDHDVNTLTFVSTPRNAKVDMFKRLLAAVALMMMGASVLKIGQGYTHDKHRSHRQTFGVVGDFEGPTNRGGPPHHLPGPPGHGPGPHFHHPPPPKPLECFALGDHKPAHFNLTVRGPVQNIFLEHSLDSAKVDIERAEESQPEAMEEDEDFEEPHHNGPPHRGPHRGTPPGPPGPHRPPPSGPHSPDPHHRPFGKSSIVLASVKPVSSDLTKSNETTYVCSLALPCGKKGLGLFHEDITKRNEMAEEKAKELKEPKEPKAFAPVSVSLTFSKGPFSVSSLMHGPPHLGGPHHHHRHGHHHHYHHSHRLQGPRKGLIKIVNFFKGKKPCNRSAKHGVPM